MLALIPKNGASSVLPIKGAPLVLVERGGEAHAVFVSTYDEMAHDGSSNSAFVPVTGASLSGFAIGADGKRRELSFDDIAQPHWETVEPFQDQDTVGLRGQTSEWRGGIAQPRELVEITWRWDPKRLAYVGKRTKRKQLPR